MSEALTSSSSAAAAAFKDTVRKRSKRVCSTLAPRALQIMNVRDGARQRGRKWVRFRKQAAVNQSAMLADDYASPIMELHRVD